MFVTPIVVQQKGKYTTFYADFIFSKPFGGKREKLLFWLRWLYALCTTPLQILRFGWRVRQRVWYTVLSTEATRTQYNDAFFLLALPLAISTQEDLVFSGAITEEALAKVEAVQAYYHEIAKRPIKVTAPVRHFKTIKSKKVGQFFTLGVDSFYTLCNFSSKSDPKQRQLIYVDGYDLPFFEKRFLEVIHHKIRRVAKDTSNKSIFIQTNIRQFSDRIIGWGRYHVSALVAASTLLDVGKIYISGESFEAQDWGLRFGVDTLYSTKKLQVKLVAHNVSREKKIRRILETAYSQLFLRSVRVCWENVRYTKLLYNCSQCQKCIKTQLTFFALRVKKTPTFLPLRITDIEKIQLVGHVYQEWQHLYFQLKKNPNIKPQLIAAVGKVLEKPIRV